ncbi:cytospin-B [Drosophila elegans]|uniref:cytospin-B n=1 Tax=Drosophila elegans TaxID=30023 RepID=UPI0007E645E8|nr:cytospin-B [Drosophila elegans]
MKERICHIRAILSDLKNDARLSEETGDWSSQEAVKMKLCLGKLILLTRAMREKYVESYELSEQDKMTYAEIFSRCYRRTKRLYLELPLGEIEGKSKIGFQLSVDAVLCELENVLRDAPTKCLRHINTETDLDVSPSDELSELREKLINAELRRELELIGHNLMLAKERSFAHQARMELHDTALRLVEEQKCVRALKESLSKSKLKLKIISEQNKELREHQYRLRKKIEPRERSLQRLKVQVTQRKCRISNRGHRAVNKSSRLNQSERETLKNLKYRLKLAKETFVEAKTEMCEIKKDIDELCFGQERLQFGVEVGRKCAINSEVNPIRRLRSKRKQTLSVIDKVLKAFSFYNRLKFPECSVKWSQLSESLQSNLIKVRQSWKRTSIKKLLPPKNKVVNLAPTPQTNACGFKNKCVSFLKPPVKYPQLPEFMWDKIYKPQVTPTTSKTCIRPGVLKELVRSVCQETGCKRSNSSVPSPCAPNLSIPNSMPKYIARPNTSVPVNGRPSVNSVLSESLLHRNDLIPKYLGKTFGNRRINMLRWCKRKVKPYGLPMYEFSESWTSGRALCAIIHSYRPDLIDDIYIRKKMPKETLTYGVKIAQSLGVCNSVDFIAECLNRHPNFEKVLDFVEELQGCLQAPI